jgi:hypothetical protein
MMVRCERGHDGGRSEKNGATFHCSQTQRARHYSTTVSLKRTGTAACARSVRALGAGARDACGIDWVRTICSVGSWYRVRVVS